MSLVRIEPLGAGVARWCWRARACATHWCRSCSAICSPPCGELGSPPIAPRWCSPPTDRRFPSVATCGVSSASGSGDLLAYSSGLVGKLNEAILALVDLPQPVVAAVHGVVTGGSIGLVLAADLAYLAPRLLSRRTTPRPASAPTAAGPRWSAASPDSAGRLPRCCSIAPSAPRRRLPGAWPTKWLRPGNCRRPPPPPRARSPPIPPAPCVPRKPCLRRRS
jgi:hypothetical protein